MYRSFVARIDLDPWIKELRKKIGFKLILAQYLSILSLHEIINVNM